MHWATIDSVFRQVCSQMGAKIQSFIVFGPVARGENSVDSDIDLLVLFAGQVERKDRVALQSVVKCHNKEDGPKISINVAVSEDFLAHLNAGDAFSKSVALEGHCLLQSAIFTAARHLVHGGTMLSDRAAEAQRLRDRNKRNGLTSSHHLNSGNPKDESLCRCNRPEYLYKSESGDR